MSIPVVALFPGVRAVSIAEQGLRSAAVLAAREHTSVTIAAHTNVGMSLARTGRTSEAKGAWEV